jgi:multidrug resistance protein, MATE family
MHNLQLHISYKQILKIALPISFAILIPQLNFFINSIFLGQLGVKELGVAGITGVYYLIFSSVGYGLNNGLQSLISRRAGENNTIEIGKLFTQGVLIALALAILGIVITYTLLPTILNAILNDQETIQLSIHYLQIRVWGLPFLFIYQMRNALLVGTNQSKYLPYGTAAETIVNIALDYALIFGKWGLPHLGFNGAAYASIIAELVGMVVTFLIIYYKGISKQFQLFAHFTKDKERLKSILQQSGPIMFQHAISIISWFLFYLLIGRMVEAKMNLAISNTMRNIFGLFGVLVWALGSTTNTMVSNVIGQGRTSEVFTVIKMLRNVSFVFTISSCIVLNIFPKFIFSWFNDDPSFVAHAVPVIRVVSGAMLIMCISVVYLNSVIASGKSKIAFFIEVAAIVFYCLYIYLVLEVFHVSLPIAWMSEWLYWTILLALSYWYLRKIYPSSGIINKTPNL